MLHKNIYIPPNIYIILRRPYYNVNNFAGTLSSAGHSGALGNICKVGPEREWKVVAKKKIGTMRRSDRTSKVNTISESSNRDVQMRQNVTGRERMKGPNDELDQITEKEKQSNIKRGHTTFPLPFLTSRVQRRLITGAKCSSLPPFSVRVIKDVSALGDESQPGCSLLTGGTERLLGPNKDMI